MTIDVSNAVKLNQLNEAQVKEFCDILPEFMALHRPHAMVKYKPDWMCEIHHDWMHLNYPTLLLHYNTELMLYLYPATAFSLNPELVFERYVWWVLKHKTEWLMENHPQALGKYSKQTYDYSTGVVKISKGVSLLSKLKAVIGLSMCKSVISEVEIPQPVVEMLNEQIAAQKSMDH